jgi:AraC-like DNA-binding protein
MGAVMGEHDPTLPIHIARAIANGAREHGVDPSPIFAAHGVTDAVLADPDARVTGQVAVALWADAARASGHPQFGLRTGERAGSGAINVAGMFLAASATLGEGFRRISQFYRVMNDAQTVHWEDTPTWFGGWLTVREVPYGVPLHATEFAFAWSVVTARAVTGVDVSPTLVAFEHDAPADLSEHERVFRCPVRFGCHRSEVRYDPSVAHLPVRSADPALVEILESHARAVLARLPTRQGLVPRVREAVARALPTGAGLDDIAASLRLSARSLQRRLRDEGTTYADVVDEVRRAMALDALREPTRGVSEVGFALGFSDASAFHKAFVRWTGKAPSVWRCALTTA